MSDTRDTAAARRAPRRFDVCNGDADGLCAVVQWRLHEPAESTLVTGLKREIALLERVPAQAGDEVLVCDVSMQRNRQALVHLLAQGVHVRYFDHHASGEVPDHPMLDAHIDMASGICTSRIVDRFLGGRHRAWAAVGAFGDNLRDAGEALAESIGLEPAQRERLRTLGEAINYNAYGDEGDVTIAPAQLYRKLARYADPLDFARSEPIAEELVRRRHADLALARRSEVHYADEGCSVYRLPDAPWSRRVIGTLANERASAEPTRAHAVLRARNDGSYVASVRAPIRAPAGAGVFCERFGGSGRAAAGGIDALAADELERFVREFSSMRWGEGG